MELVVRHPRRRRDNGDVEEFNIKHPLLELRLTPIKGLGLFAKKDIKRGTCLLSEAPLLVVNTNGTVKYRDLQQQLEKLSPDQHDVLYGLQHNTNLQNPRLKVQIRDQAAARGKFKKNKEALEVYVDSQLKAKVIFDTNVTSLSNAPGSAVFALYSRINHSCTPNVHANYNPVLARHTIYSIRDIGAGEEILTSYIDAAQPYGERMEHLAKRGITACQCAKCLECVDAVSQPAHDRRREDIFLCKHAIRAYEGDASQAERLGLPIWFIPRNPAEALKKTQEMIRELLEEGLVGMDLAAAFRWASNFNLQLGDLANAMALSKMEAGVELYCLGEDTSYLSDNAESWAAYVSHTAEKDGVKMRMCEKRVIKENKRMEKKAEKKAKKK